MIIIDRALRKRAAESAPIRVAMVGAGLMGRAIAHQIVNSTMGMELVAIANRTIDRARDAYAEAGVSDVSSVETASALEDAIRDRGCAVTDDPRVLCDAESVDALIEVTGTVEFAAGTVLRAIERRKPTVLMNAELDGTVGPVLQALAARAGVVLTTCDGDQPGVELNLYRFAVGIGLRPLVCGNIKGLQDPYRTPTTQADWARRWGQDVHMVTSFADGTKMAFEQAIVANTTGMSIAKRGMVGRSFDGHVDDLTEHYDVDELERLGGVVDYVVGSRPAPGVFVLATHDDPKQRKFLALYKLGKGPLYSLYTPFHLCHFEVPNSVARAVLFDDPVSGMAGTHVDVVTTAKTDLKAGTVLDGIGGYHAYGQCERSDVARAEGLLPMGQSGDCTLRRPIRRDSVIRYEDVDLPEGRLVDRLRRDQDCLFAQSTSAQPSVSLD